MVSPNVNGIPPLNLTSLKGLSLVGLPRVIEVSSGSQEDMEAEITAQLKPLTQATSQPATAVIQKLSPIAKAKRKRAERIKAEDMTVTSETLTAEKPKPQPFGPVDELPIETPPADATSQPIAKFEITSSESLGRLDEFLNRFIRFGFYIPPAVALTWQKQTVTQLENVLASWSRDFSKCFSGHSVQASERDLTPPLIDKFDTPSPGEMKIAYERGRAASQIESFSVAHNPYPVATELAGKWSEGFRQVDSPIKPASFISSQTFTSPAPSPIKSMPTLGPDAPSSIIQSGIRRVQADIDRQSRIDSLLSQLFAERDTVAALQEEITETKAALKTLTESRDEHQAEEERIIEMLKVETENSKEEE